MRKVLPISLILTVALFGCTMNRTPGDGQPVTATPSMGPAATPGTSYGNKPMTSSYLTPSNDRLAADQAAALMREHEAYRGRVLGYLSAQPGMAQQQQAGPAYATGQFVSPALQVNPQVTVNSSISSQPTPVISSGAGDATGAAAATTGAFVVPGGATSTVTAATTTGTTAASTVTAAASTVSPTVAASTPTPTVASGATASPIATTGTILSSTASNTGNVVSTTATPTVTPSTNSTMSTGLASGVTTPIVIQSSNAKAAPITITNTGGQISISNVRNK